MTLNKDELKCQLIQGAHIFKEWMIYVTTLTFSLLAIFSAATFCFLVPLLIEPALATLQHKFIQTNCSTISGEWMEGRHKCQWSSCREGCTKEIFDCWQIRVKYHKNMTSIEERGYEGKLFPNVHGCGYPPRTVCDEFAAKYGRPDSQFPCFYSQIDPKRVITELDFQEISDTLVYGVTIPCATFCVSVIYLVIAYIHIYPRQEDPDLSQQKQIESVQLQAEEENLTVEELGRRKHKQDVEMDRKTFRHQLYTEQNKFIDF